MIVVTAAATNILWWDLTILSHALAGAVQLHGGERMMCAREVHIHCMQTHILGFGECSHAFA